MISKARSALICWCLCVLQAHAASGGDAAHGPLETVKTFTVVLDPGHTPRQPGALGVRGIYEVAYNDVLSAKLARALQAASIQVVLTRLPAQEIILADRAELANKRQPDLFLSVHHDSAQLKYLVNTEFNGLAAYQTIAPMAGYSIFVSKLNPGFEQSYQFARLLGQALRQLGRPPSLHHAEPIAGENRLLLDAKLGIYRFDELLVLRQTLVPAVLLEVGLIVDSGDERYVTDSARQDAIVDATVEAIRAWRDQLVLAR